MRIRARVRIAGNGFSLEAGEETDRFADAQAIDLVNAGYAVPVGGMPIETTAAAPAPEARREPFGGKGDHDGDGKVGGSKPKARRKKVGG